MANLMIHTPSYLATADINKYWNSSSSVTSIASGWYKSSSGSNEGDLYKTVTPQSGFTLGFKFKATGSVNSYTTLAEWLDSAIIHVTLDFNSQLGLFRVTRGGSTVLQTGVTTLSVGTEYYIEWQVTIADSGGVSILHIDGATDTGINSSALDTRNAGNASANQLHFQLSRTVNQNVQIKDIYLNDNTGGVDDTFWGPIAVPTMVVSSNGNKSQWTPLSSTNASNVDDATTDDDTTYNSTATNGNIDTFVMTDTGYASGTVKGVEWVADIRKTDASGTAKVAPVYRISSTDYVGSDVTPTTTYLLQSVRNRQSPATSSAWTVSELDGLEAGYKRTAA